LALEVIEQQLSVRALEARIQRLLKQTKAKGKRKHPQELFIKAAAEELTQTWGTRIEIKAKGKAGTLVMHYGSEGELDHLFEALKHGPAKRR
jgi:ParB family transcriptional regulator, chromosome partitioning protein